jgi:pimeloyl-ACP methyl ester carboxylesterase
MSDAPPCGQPCGLACAGPSAEGACPNHQPLALSEAVARFASEARRGTCDTGRYRMPYYTWGAGPPLVFIHGVSDSSASFVLPIARLSRHFRCIAYDLPSGHGDGARLWRYRHEHLVEDLFALLDHAGAERAYVLASSFGATVALRALAARPERLPRAILQGGLAYRPLRRAERWLAWLARLLPGPMARVPRREKLLELMHREPFARQPEEVWRAFVEQTGKARLAALGHQAHWLHRLDLRPTLASIRQPVLLVHGDQDRTVPRAHADVLHAGLLSAGLVVLEGCGHVPSYTHPEALAEVVRRFLTPAASLSTCEG